MRTTAPARYGLAVALLLAGSGALAATPDTSLTLAEIDRSKETKVGGWMVQHKKDKTGDHHKFFAQAPSADSEVFAWLRCTDEFGFRMEIVREYKKRRYEPSLPVLVTVDNHPTVRLEGMEHYWSKNYNIDIHRAEGIEELALAGRVMRVVVKGKDGDESFQFRLDNLGKARRAILAVCPTTRSAKRAAPKP